MTLTPEVALAVTSNHTSDTREVEFTKYSKYGISYAPDTELAQDKVNRHLGRDMTSRTRSYLTNQRLQTLETFSKPYKKVEHATTAKASSFKNVAYSEIKLPVGWHPPPAPPPNCTGEG